MDLKRALTTDLVLQRLTGKGYDATYARLRYFWEQREAAGRPLQRFGREIVWTEADLEELAKDLEDRGALTDGERARRAYIDLQKRVKGLPPEGEDIEGIFRIRKNPKTGALEIVDPGSEVKS